MPERDRLSGRYQPRGYDDRGRVRDNERRRDEIPPRHYPRRDEIPPRNEPRRDEIPPRDYSRQYAPPRDNRGQGYRPYNQPQPDDQNGDEPPPTLMGQLKMLKVDLKRLNKAIERAFPDTADEIAYRLVRITPRAIAVCYLLLAAGIVASQLNILWTEGSLWGIASLSTIMIGVFLWVWSSNVMKLPDLSDDAKTALRRAMRIQASTFIAAVLTIIYFIGMAFRYW